MGPMKVGRKLRYKLISDQQRPFTKQLAGRFTTMDTFVGDRSLSPRHIARLANATAYGYFLPEFVILASCECVWDGKERRLNGQHTCWMRRLFPASWKPKVRVIRYRVETEKGFRKLYSVIDRAWGRNNRHVVKSKLYGTPPYKGISPDGLNRLSSGLRMWAGKGSNCALSIDETTDSMLNGSGILTIRVAKFLDSITALNAGHMYRRAPVTGALFATFDRCLSAALEFWKIVRDGGEAPDHPAQMLMKYLISTEIHSNCSGGPRTKITTSRENMYRVCIEAWNAFRKGEKVTEFKVPERRVAVR
jgi:hypothetical protein